MNTHLAKETAEFRSWFVIIVKKMEFKEYGRVHLNYIILLVILQEAQNSLI